MAMATAARDAVQTFFTWLVKSSSFVESQRAGLQVGLEIHAFRVSLHDYAVFAKPFSNCDAMIPVREDVVPPDVVDALLVLMRAPKMDGFRTWERAAPASHCFVMRHFVHNDGVAL
jgi:hypothetical protein